MTHQEFLTIFTKHLYVGGTKRTELIDELRAHLEELDAKESPEIKLGNPRQLARQYNHEHLGLLGSVGFMYFLPSVVAMLALSWLMVDDDLIIGMIWILLISCILILPVWVSMNVIRMHQAKRKITLYLLLAPVISTATLTIVSYIFFRISPESTPLDVLTHVDWKMPGEQAVFSWKDQIGASLLVTWFGYFFSLVVFCGVLLVQGFMKLNVSIFPKTKK